MFGNKFKSRVTEDGIKVVLLEPKKETLEKGTPVRYNILKELVIR